MKNERKSDFILADTRDSQDRGCLFDIHRNITAVEHLRSVSDYACPRNDIYSTDDSSSSTNYRL